MFERFLLLTLLTSLIAGCDLEQSSIVDDLTNQRLDDPLTSVVEPVDALVIGMINDSDHVISRKDARNLRNSIKAEIMEANYPAEAFERNRRYIEAAKILLGIDNLAREILESYDHWGADAAAVSDAINLDPIPRTFVPTTIEELQEKLAPLDPSPSWAARQIRNRTPQVDADIDVVDFNMENSDVLAYETTSTGLSYVLVEGGGDWEVQVRFIVYWDGEQLRGYIPLRGNPFNRTHRIAFGNAGHWPSDENLSPAEKSEKQEAEEHAEVKRQLLEAGIDFGSEQDFDNMSCWEAVMTWVPMMWDFDKIKEDVTERIKRAAP